MDRELLHSPAEMLQQLSGDRDDGPGLEGYEEWWCREGQSTSESVDRAGTPWLKLYNRAGKRIDQVQFEPGYREILLKGYREGVIWRAFEQNRLRPFYRLGYVTSFYDPGLYCPYTVSMATALAIKKYADPRLRDSYLPQMLRKDQSVQQGATWMTEIGGGSDLGASVKTRAVKSESGWLLSGEKYFASNVGAELAIVAARPDGAAPGVRGLALFLLPRLRRSGELNYLVRRLKNKIGTRSVATGEVELVNSEAYLIGEPQQGIYLILESLNISRVANSVACVALAQRALSESQQFASGRELFGSALLEQPLFRRQFDRHLSALETSAALAWEAVTLLEEVWRETPPYSDRYHLFRLVAHLAKYQTAEHALAVSQWAMQAHGALGILAEFPVERWFREAMILAIWEGTAHRQILDGLEVMQRKQAHEMLFEHIGSRADQGRLNRLRKQIQDLLQIPQDQQEASVEAVFSELALFTGEAVANTR